MRACVRAHVHLSLSLHVHLLSRVYTCLSTHATVLHSFCSEICTCAAFFCTRGRERHKAILSAILRKHELTLLLSTGPRSCAASDVARCTRRTIQYFVLKKPSLQSKCNCKGPSGGKPCGTLFKCHSCAHSITCWDAILSECNSLYTRAVRDKAPPAGDFFGMLLKLLAHCFTHSLTHKLVRTHLCRKKIEIVSLILQRCSLVRNK